MILVNLNDIYSGWHTFRIYLVINIINLLIDRLSLMCKTVISDPPSLASEGLPACHPAYWPASRSTPRTDLGI